jgi:enamine deaminase RidA (YjgF/YER057c/UK114 family)
MPATFEAQAQQTMNNVNAVVEAAGLTLDHVVYTHAYLEDISHAAALDRVYGRYFPKDPPARAMIGVARLPGTPVESMRSPFSIDMGEPPCACRAWNRYLLSQRVLLLADTWQDTRRYRSLPVEEVECAL